MYQKCVLGVLVGFQVRMDPVSLKPNHGPAAKDDLGIDDIRMVRRERDSRFPRNL